MKTLTLTLTLTLAMLAPAEAQSRMARVALGVASMALGGYALAYDPPDISADVRGEGTATHRDFRCVRSTSIPAGTYIVRIGNYCKGAVETRLVDLRTGLFTADTLIVAGPTGPYDHRDSRRIDDNTTYRVNTTTRHTTIVNRSTAQMAAGAGAIVAGALLALWPDSPLEVEARPDRVRIARTFGF